MTRDIIEKIITIRDRRVLLDFDLADLYGVTTKRLNEQVKRNIRRFPEEFMFRLTGDEFKLVLNMRSQTATGSKRNLRYSPFAFTEHGAIMLASVLDSLVAIEMSISVVKAFVQMRSLIENHKELSLKLEDLERKYSKHDGELKVVFNTLRQLMEPIKPKPKRQIGF